MTIIINFFIALLLALPLVFKSLFVEKYIHDNTGTNTPVFLQVISNDALIYGALLLLLYLSVLSKTPRLAAAVFRLLALAIFAVYCIDYVIITNFTTHLVVGDAIKYTGYVGKYIQQVYGLGPISLGAVGALLSALLLWFAFSPYRIKPRSYRPLPIAVLLAVPLASGFTGQQTYVHSWIYQNVIDYNLTILSESAPYSQNFIDGFQYAENKTCQALPANKKNVIILMVESLSAYHSQYFSGLNNWTPQLDAIAQSNQAFKNFYANGFITEDGEVSLLTGIPPIYPPSNYSDQGGRSFYSFYGIEDSLPNILKKQGYETEFLTTADLEFSGTGAWAKSLGFDYVEGHDHPDYDKWERFHFKAAPDAALYQRALKRVQGKQKKPLFLFMKTVSSHHPYINPENKHKSESETISYTDKQIGEFYQQLLAKGFFNNGLLFIVGDHHSMMPIKKAELDLFGQYKAAARVPLVLVGNGLASTETHQFQQTDVFNSVKGLTTGEQCHSDWNGFLLGDNKIPPRYISHRRGDNRNLVSVFADNNEFLVKLDGDQTLLLDKLGLSDADASSMVAKINGLRLDRISWTKTKAQPTDL